MCPFLAATSYTVRTLLAWICRPARSLRRQAAIDDQRLTGDVGRLAVGQEERGVDRWVRRGLAPDGKGDASREQEQLDRLRELGCDMAQGYYFARPLTRASVTVVGL